MVLSGASSAESEPRRGQKRSEGRRSRSVEAGAWAIALFMVAQTRRAQVCTEHEYVHESMQRPGPAQPAAATRGEHVDGSVVRVIAGAADAGTEGDDTAVHRANVGGRSR